MLHESIGLVGGHLVLEHLSVESIAVGVVTRGGQRVLADGKSVLRLRADQSGVHAADTNRRNL